MDITQIETRHKTMYSHWDDLDRCHLPLPKRAVARARASLGHGQNPLVHTTDNLPNPRSSPTDTHDDPERLFGYVMPYQACLRRKLQFLGG